MSSKSSKSGRKSSVTIIRTGKALGAEIQGVDLQTVDANDFSIIYQAWLDHSVLLFRGQNLTDDDLIAFSEKFGDLDWAPVQESGRRFVEGHPEIYVVSNVMENGAPIGSLGAGEATWHTDMSYLEDPPKASILYALEVPASGGNTYFNSMYRAYEFLPDAMKKRIEGKTLKHDATYNSGGYVRQGITAIDDPLTSPGTYHLSFARIRKPSAVCFTWGAAAMRILRDYRFRSPNPCSMSCGSMRTARNSNGIMNGASATSSFGTIGAPCTGAILSTQARGELCTAPRLRARLVRALNGNRMDRLGVSRGRRNLTVTPRNEQSE